MSRRPATILPALLLLAVMAAQLVQVASFELRRMTLRREMKQQIRQGLPQEALVRFSFTPAAYEALETEDGGREFWVDGHLYDLVRRNTGADGHVHIEAVDDRDEAHLMAGLNELLEQGMARRGMDRERSRSLVSALACSPPVEPLDLMAFDAGEGLRFHVRCEPLLERAPGELFHPPRS